MSDTTPDITPSPLIHGYHSRGYLPHKKVSGKNYFVTYRLADSLPREVLLRLEEEIEQLIATLPANTPASYKEEQAQLKRHREIEKLLDRGSGKCWLKHPAIAGLVAGNLVHFHGQRYRLKAWVVMPNHVHALVQPISGFTLGEIVKTWKQYTAMRARRMLDVDLNNTGNASASESDNASESESDNAGESTRFWQPESYDHYVRDADDYDRIVHYIHWNPVKARLCAKPEDWPWSSASSALSSE